MLIPVLEPVVFLGIDVLEPKTGELYFQNAETHLRGLRIETASSEELQEYFHAQGRDETKHIFTFEHALDEVLRCALRRSRR
jgi:hypothetical protein